MKTVKLKNRSRITIEVSEGESIEKKIERMTDSQEPIGETAPIVYTKKSDGIIPAYDIRTDKWDVALDAMNKVNGKRKQISELGGMEAYKKAVADGVLDGKEELN